MSEFYILVDYDNLEKNACFSVSQFATAIMEIVKKLDQKSVFFNSSSKLQNINILLYGGWFFNDRLRTMMTRIHISGNSRSPGKSWISHIRSCGRLRRRRRKRCSPMF